MGSITPELVARLEAMMKDAYMTGYKDGLGAATDSINILKKMATELEEKDEKDKDAARRKELQGHIRRLQEAERLAPNDASGPHPSREPKAGS